MVLVVLGILNVCVCFGSLCSVCGVIGLSSWLLFVQCLWSDRSEFVALLCAMSVV